MIIEDGKFYFIKDEFFKLFEYNSLMSNKENGNRRPCYFCFRDRKYKEIIWFVPISTKYEKYKKIYNIKKEKVLNKPVYNFIFCDVLNVKSVFLIQNIFPTTEEYILEKYKNSNRDVEIPVAVKNKIISTSLKVIALAENNIHIPFYDILDMRKSLLDKRKNDI